MVNIPPSNETERQLTHLERENARLEKLVADQAAEISALKRVASGQTEHGDLIDSEERYRCLMVFAVSQSGTTEVLF